MPECRRENDEEEADGENLEQKSARVLESRNEQHTKESAMIVLRPAAMAANVCRPTTEACRLLLLPYLLGTGRAPSYRGICVSPMEDFNEG